jgi:hypothetical protein
MSNSHVGKARPDVGGRFVVKLSLAMENRQTLFICDVRINDFLLADP